MKKHMKKNTTYRSDLFSTFLNQIWRVFSGPLMLLSIPFFLTPEVQGFWYTFISLATLSVLADLGFSNIILQFSAHEFAFLRFREDRTLVGDAYHLYKLSDFFLFSIRWLVKIILFIFPLIIIGGYFFISYYTPTDITISGWVSAWIIYSFASAFVFVNSILLSFFEGLNLVGKVQQLRFQIAVVATLAMFLGLVLHLDLFALAASNIVSSICGIVLIFKNFRNLICQFIRIETHEIYNWWPEFSSLIWRYALSWGSGFLVFQLFTPMTFYFHGPVAAGKIGISIAMWTAGFNIAISWITAITPKMNMLIAEKNWKHLDSIFLKSLIKSVGTMVVGGSIFFTLEYWLYSDVSFFHRIIEPKGMIILFIAWLIQVVINAMAIYLRAHKKEPLVYVSCLNAVIVIIGTLICGKFLNEAYLFGGFFFGSLIQCPLVYFIFCRFRNEHRGV